MPRKYMMMNSGFIDSRNDKSGRSADLQQLDLEGQLGIRRNHSSEPRFAVGQFAGNDELANAARFHADHALVPALDDFADSELEDQRFVAINRALLNLQEFYLEVQLGGGRNVAGSILAVGQVGGHDQFADAARLHAGKSQFKAANQDAFFQGDRDRFGRLVDDLAVLEPGGVRQRQGVAAFGVRAAPA